MQILQKPCQSRFFLFECGIQDQSNGLSIVFEIKEASFHVDVVCLIYDLFEISYGKGLARQL